MGVFVYVQGESWYNNLCMCVLIGKREKRRERMSVCWRKSVRERKCMCVC